MLEALSVTIVIIFSDISYNDTVSSYSSMSLSAVSTLKLLTS